MITTKEETLLFDSDQPLTLQNLVYWLGGAHNPLVARLSPPWFSRTEHGGRPLVHHCSAWDWQSKPQNQRSVGSDRIGEHSVKLPQESAFTLFLLVLLPCIIERCEHLTPDILVFTLARLRGPSRVCSRSIANRCPSLDGLTIGAFFVGRLSFQESLLPLNPCQAEENRHDRRDGKDCHR